MVKSLPPKALWGSFIREILTQLSVKKLIIKLNKIFLKLIPTYSLIDVDQVKHNWYENISKNLIYYKKFTFRYVLIISRIISFYFRGISPFMQRPIRAKIWANWKLTNWSKWKGHVIAMWFQIQETKCFNDMVSDCNLL